MKWLLRWFQGKERFPRIEPLNTDLIGNGFAIAKAVKSLR